MQLPLQVSFHGLPVSESVERDVHRHVTELEKAFPRIISCRVSIEIPHRHQRRGRRYRVRVDLGFPGFNAVAGHAAGERAEHEDVYLAVDDAFRAVRRQLEEHVGRRDSIRAAETA